MTRGRKHWLITAAVAAVIIAGMLVVDILLKPSQDAIRWAFGIAVALLVADTIATRLTSGKDS